MEQASAEFGRNIEPQINAFKLDKGINEIIRFKGQVGMPLNDPEETELQLIRQANEILRYKNYLEESIVNWLKGAQDSQNQEITALKLKLKAILEGLKHEEMMEKARA